MKPVPISERSVADGEDTVSTREHAVQDRESAALVREASVQLREDAATLRQETFDARDAVARANTDLETHVMAQLREANENLVVATVHAQELTEASERASQQKEQFLAMLAHELRNPLAPIVNALAVLHRVDGPDSLVPWAHNIIKRQIDHMTRLLDDLLDVSRVTSGKITLKKRLTTVSEVMLAAVEASHPLIQNRMQHLTIVQPPQPLTVDGDPERLVQVFSNLLNNASKYTQEGGTITFSGRRQGSAVVLRVADNGVGIEAKALAGIFDLFTQEDRSLAHAHGGLGIGLTIVRGIVEMHGGTVTAQSRGPGEGSEFGVTLPLVENQLHIRVVEADTEPASPEMASRIVLIDDNIDATSSLKILLELMGCKVAIALDGVTGVSLVQADRPQIVLCDIGLPGMDGYAVIARLREEMKPPLPLMIALTGYGQPEDRTRALAAGFDHHLVKPVDADYLLRLIASHQNRISGVRGK